LVDLRSDLASSFSSQDEIERLCMHSLLADPAEMVFAKDRESRLLFVSAGWLASFAPGCSLDQVIGKTDFDFFSRSHALAAFADEQRVIETGQPMAAKVEAATLPDRRDNWLSTTKLPLSDTHGKIIGTWGISRDITAQIAAEQALAASHEQLRESERQHRLLFEHNPQPMAAYARETLQILAVSNALVAKYGYSREEFLTMTMRDLFPREDHGSLERYLTARVSGEQPGPTSATAWKHRLKDGTIIDVEIAGDDLDLGGNSCRLVCCQDVTERNWTTAQLAQAREQLRTSAEEHRLLFEHNPQPLLAYDRETLQIVAVSNAATASNGYSREEFLEMTLLDLSPFEDHAAMIDYARTHPLLERMGLDRARPRRHRCKDGTTIDVEVTSDDLVLGGRRCRVCLCQDVTERNRTNAELAIARDEAVQASNMKSAFLANMSHEIRTPMNGVIGMNELLLDTELTDEQREYAEQVASSGAQMLAIISDILDVSKIEAGRLELDVTDFALQDAIEQTCAVVGLQAEAQGTKLKVHIEADVPRHVRGDRGRLGQVLLNLVSNAVKFTTGGEVAVHVSTRRRGGEDPVVRIEVADTGIGIEPEALDRMFEPFTQADVSTTRNYGGTGLGLAIARELIELMGGTIGAESESGHGSTFWFELAFSAPVAPDRRPPRPESLSVDARPLWLTAPLLLVAEDNAVNQIIAVAALERCGCRVEVVNDGRKALEALSTRSYDAVLMDCQMPEMDGYEATAELRRRESGDRHTPVIAMTAHAMAGDRENCLEAGMDDYISKPMRRQQLIDTLQRWIPQHTDTAVAHDLRSNRS
jgi:PAS domain S-box-containing protein